MVEFEARAVTEYITCIHGICHERMYLVEGTQKAALIDSGSGFGSLLAQVRKFTQKPVLLLLTHAHTDHAMGAEEFEQVWFNQADLPVFLQHGDLAFRLSGLQLSRKGKYVTPEDVIPTADPSRFHPLGEGDRFDLGGITLEAFSCPGHTPGTMVFLDRKHRILFSGDAFSNATLLLGPESFTVEGYLNSILSFQKRVGDSFDRVLEAHGTGELPKGILNGVAEVCRELLAGQSDRVAHEFRGMTGFLAKKRKPHSLEREDGGIGNVIYQEERLFD